MELELFLEPGAEGGSTLVARGRKGGLYKLKKINRTGLRRGAKRLGKVNLASTEMTPSKAAVLDYFRPVLLGRQRPSLREKMGGGTLYLRRAEALMLAKALDLATKAYDVVGVKPSELLWGQIRELSHALMHLGPASDSGPKPGIGKLPES